MKNILIFFFGLFLFVSCSKEIPVLATLEATLVSDVSSNSVTISSNIIDDGGSAVVIRGVCWSIAENPTLESNKTVDGTEIGKFTSLIKDLNPGITYYFRSYAVNSVGKSHLSMAFCGK